MASQQARSRYNALRNNTLWNEISERVKISMMSGKQKQKLGVRIEVDVDLSVIRLFAGITSSLMSDLQLIAFER